MRKIKREMGNEDIDTRALVNQGALERKNIIDLCAKFALEMRNRMLEKHKEGRRDWNKPENDGYFQLMAKQKADEDGESIDAANYNMLVWFHTKEK